jgi:hypothetical protein
MTKEEKKEDIIMAKFKDFGVGTAPETTEVISFKLHEEEFFCVPQIQGRVMLSLVKNSSSEDPTVAAGTIETFFEQVLTDESLERFNALTTDKNKIVTTETLGQIVGWLLEEYSGRPEAQPEV